MKNMLNGIRKTTSLLLAIIVLTTGMTTMASAKVVLVPGEVIVGDTIIGVEEAVSVNSPLRSRSNCPNYATSVESFQLRYNGYIQFRPSYKTGSNDGSGLQADRYVKQGWIDYRRNDKSVIGGNVYTTAASLKTDNNIYSADASCWDSLIPGESHRTYFYRGWKYFA